jgi:hypothetical protein
LAEGQKTFKIPHRNVKIPPGKSVFNLSEEVSRGYFRGIYSKASVIGEYMIERVIVQIGQLMLSYTLFPEEGLKVDVTVSKPNVWLNVPPKGNISTPQNFPTNSHFPMSPHIKIIF